MGRPIEKYKQAPNLKDPELPRKPCHKVIRNEKEMAARCRELGLTLTLSAGGLYKLTEDATGRCVECYGLWAAEHVMVGYQLATSIDRPRGPGLWRDET